MAEAGQLNRYCQKWPGKKLDFAGVKGIRVFLGKVVRIWITGSQISWWHWLQIIQVERIKRNARARHDWGP